MLFFMHPFKTSFVSLLACVGLSGSFDLQAQPCTDIQEGMKMTMEIASYPLIHDKVGAEFYTMKPKKKAEKAAAYAEELASGSVQPASKYSLTYTVIGKTPEGEYDLATDIAGTSYHSYVSCKDGNLYLLRIKGITYSIVNGDTLGWGTKGVQTIPQNLSVGSLTPGYVDESVLTYNNTDVRKTSFAIGDASYSPGSGSLTTMSYTGYVPAKVSYSVKGKVITINQSGVVYDKETLTISGKPHECFKVRTEIWTKNDTKADTKVELDNWFSDPSFNKQIYSQIQGTADKVDKRLKVKADEAMGVNKAGYLVTYKEEWIYPRLGALKTQNYDQWGCLTSTITTTAIN